MRIGGAPYTHRRCGDVLDSVMQDNWEDVSSILILLQLRVYQTNAMSNVGLACWIRRLGLACVGMVPSRRESESSLIERSCPAGPAQSGFSCGHGLPDRSH